MSGLPATGVQPDMLDAGASEAKVLLLLYANGDGVSFFDTRTNKGDESIS